MWNFMIACQTSRVNFFVNETNCSGMDMQIHEQNTEVGSTWLKLFYILKWLWAVDHAIIVIFNH